MRNFVIALMFLSTSAFAQRVENQEVAFAQSKQQAHDAQVGWCSAYHMLTGNYDASKEVEKMAVNKYLMARSANALAVHYQKSERDKKNALLVGKNSCASLKFVPKRKP